MYIDIILINFHPKTIFVWWVTGATSGDVYQYVYGYVDVRNVKTNNFQLKPIVAIDSPGAITPWTSVSIFLTEWVMVAKWMDDWNPVWGQNSVNISVNTYNRINPITAMDRAGPNCIGKNFLVSSDVGNGWGSMISRKFVFLCRNASRHVAEHWTCTGTHWKKQGWEGGAWSITAQRGDH